MNNNKKTTPENACPKVPTAYTSRQTVLKLTSHDVFTFDLPSGDAPVMLPETLLRQLRLRPDRLPTEIRIRVVTSEGGSLGELDRTVQKDGSVRVWLSDHGILGRRKVHAAAMPLNPSRNFLALLYTGPDDTTPPEAVLDTDFGMRWFDGND